MSSIKKVLKDTLPNKIYLDTAFFVDVIIETRENIMRHEKAFKFSRRLEKSRVTIICSKLSFIEFWNASFNIKLKDTCGNKKIVSVIKHENLISEIFKWTEDQYGKLMFFLETLTKRPILRIKESIGVYDMGAKVHDNARKIAIKYKLPIYDAIHFNTMLQANTNHIVTENIDDFRHLENIYIWSYR